jgi:phosphoribosylaminoimidazole carboxylase PurE protein
VVQIATVIGSANDVRLVRESGMHQVFDAVGLTVPVHVISCHRNPTELDRFCREVPVDIYIAAAGLAAGLPGAIAAVTSMRRVVIGVPLDDYGIDSVIRLPSGVPVLTAGVGKAGLRNAAIAACQVAALTDPQIAERLVGYFDQVARTPQFDIQLADA